MATFHFSLEQVLTYREQLKEQAEVAYARAKANLLREEEEAERLRQTLSEHEKKLYSLDPSHQDERWLLENYIKGVRTDLDETMLRVRMLVELEKEARQELIKRAKDHKILEKLKSRQMEHYLFDERMQEQHSYDESAALRFKAPTI